MRALPLVLLLSLASCVTTEDAPRDEAREVLRGPDGRVLPPPPKAWTPAFTENAILIADVVEIEGPRGLLEHVAVRVVDEYQRQQVETLPEGFRQVVEVVEPGAGVEIEAHLDALQIAAFSKLVVLERPGDVPVRVRARGEVLHKVGDEPATEASSLELRGELAQ